ncbi:MAG: T9SS type B sorting domain-containing protein [Bacteroidia bacterium]
MSRSSQGKIAVVSNFVATSAFQNKTLSGGGGYLAILNAATGDLDTVFHAGSQGWLIDHEPGGNMLVLGLQTSYSDSIASKKLPGLLSGNQVFLARVLSNGNTDKVMAIPKQNGTFTSAESFRSLHVNKAGQIFLSGELESEVWISPNVLLSLKVPHQSGRPQAVLAKLDESFTCSWFAGVGSRDTVGNANKNIGAGVFSDPEGNIVWCTMNDAYSVVSTHLRLNNDTFDKGILTSRYSAHGVHVWKFSEPSVKTLLPLFTTYCPGDSIHIPYQKFGEFSPGNRFRLELSDSTGAFLNPLLLKEVSDTSSGTIHALIPLSGKTSALYRLRVNATAPGAYGSILENAISIRGKPNADAGPDRYFCLGDTVRVLAGGGGTYFWSGGSGILQDDSAMLLALPDSHRLYQVRVTDSLSSCFNTDSVMLRYREKLVLDEIPDTLACLGDSLVFNAHILVGDTGRVVYSWTDTLGNTLSQADSLIWHALTPNRIRLVAWDSCSVLPDTQEFRISLRPALQVSSTPDTLVCSNLPLTLLARGSGGDDGNYRFIWYDSAFQQVLAEGLSFTSLFPSGKQIGLSLSDGCTALGDSLTIRVEVAEKPVIIKLDTIRVCAMDTLTLRVDAAGGFPGPLLYSWDSAAYTPADSFLDFFTTSREVSVLLKDVCGLTSLGKTQVQLRSSLVLTVRPDTSFCLGEQAQLYVTGSEADTGHYSFFWKGQATSRNYFWEKPAQAKTFLVRIHNNCDASERLDSVVLFVRDSLHIALSIDTPYCYGERILLTPVLSGGNATNHSLNWKEGNGNLIGNFPSYSFTLYGSKEMWLVLEDGCTEISDSLLVQLTTLPALSIENPGDTLLCEGALFRFEPTLSGGRSANYSYAGTPWNSASLSNGVTVTSPETLEIIAQDGCSESDTMRFNVLVRDPLEVDLPADTALCRGSGLQLFPVISGGLPGNYSFFWQGIASTTSQHTLILTKDTTLIFRVTDACSTPAGDTIHLTAFSLPDAAFSLIDNPVCVPESVIAQSIFSSQNARWHWRSEALGLDTITTLSALSIQIAKMGKFRIELEITDSNGCISIPIPDTLEAFPTPNAWFSFADTVIDRGKGVDLFLIEGQMVGSIWSPFTLDSLAPGHFFFVPDDTGYYFIRHQATNQWGCGDVYTAGIRVKEPFQCYVPTAFHPSGFMENRLFLPLCEPYTDYHLIVYSRWGQIVFESSASMPGWDGSYMGKGEMMPGGVYVYLLRVGNEQHEVFQSTGTVTLIK